MPFGITPKIADFRTCLEIWSFVLAGKPTNSNEYILTFKNTVAYGYHSVTWRVNMKTRRYAVDRIVDGMIILVPDGEYPQLTLPCSEYHFSVNDVVDVCLSDDGRIASCLLCEGVGEKRRSESAARLHSLFSRSKK